MRQIAGRLLTHALLAVAGVMPVSAGGIVPGALSEAAMPVTTVGQRVYRFNPATMHYLDTVSESVLSAGASYEGSGRAVMEQLGTGSRNVTVAARSYRKMNSSTTVWGNASFETEHADDVRWTDVIDYRRVAPYVLGDSVGGCLSTRTYTFGGGVAYRSGRWTTGVEAGYRAAVAGRSRDPRVRTVVSDLKVRLGAARMVGDRHMAGFCGSLEIYSQNCDLDFYNPVNDIDTYTLTGLGTFYRRFMGNTNKNSGYSSLGFSAGAQLVTVDRSGLKVAARYSQWRMSQQLRDFNNLTLAFSDHRSVEAEISWRFESASVTTEPAATLFIDRQTGTENLFGTSQGASYDKIGSRSPYRHNVVSAAVELPAETMFGTLRAGLNPRVAYESDNESLSEPRRSLKASHLVPSLTAVVEIPSGASWTVGVKAGYEKAVFLSGERITGSLDATSGPGECVVSNYEMLSASRNRFGASVEAGKKIGGMSVIFGAGFSMTRYQGLATRRCAAVSVSFKF